MGLEVTLSSPFSAGTAPWRFYKTYSRKKKRPILGPHFSACLFAATEVKYCAGETVSFAHGYQGKLNCFMYNTLFHEFLSKLMRRSSQKCPLVFEQKKPGTETQEQVKLI